MSELSEKAAILATQAEDFARNIQNISLKKVYIAGPMSGLENFNREAFYAVAHRLRNMGYVTLNPATLPDGLSQAEYMDICCAMVRVSDCIVMLCGWEKSEGAMAEYYLAKKLGKKVIHETASVSYLAAKCKTSSREVLFSSWLGAQTKEVRAHA